MSGPVVGLVVPASGGRWQPPRVEYGTVDPSDNCVACKELASMNERCPNHRRTPITLTCTTTEPNGKCCTCRTRPATETVYGSPGGETRWCRRCLVESMLKSARESAARVPDLELELAAIVNAEFAAQPLRDLNEEDGR